MISILSKRLLLTIKNKILRSLTQAALQKKDRKLMMTRKKAKNPNNNVRKLSHSPYHNVHRRNLHLFLLSLQKWCHKYQQKK